MMGCCNVFLFLEQGIPLSIIYLASSPFISAYVSNSLKEETVVRDTCLRTVLLLPLQWILWIGWLSTIAVINQDLSPPDTSQYIHPVLKTYGCGCWASPPYLKLYLLHIPYGTGRTGWLSIAQHTPSPLRLSSNYYNLLRFFQNFNLTESVAWIYMKDMQPGHIGLSEVRRIEKDGYLILINLLNI